MRIKAEDLINGTSFIGDSFRFVVAGGLNTALTFAVYQLFLLFFTHTVSYTVSWIIGICFLIIVYPSKVFPQGTNSLNRRLLAVLIYIIVFGVGLICLNILVGTGINPRYAIFHVLIISTGLNFVAMRFVFRTKRFFNTSKW